MWTSTHFLLIDSCGGHGLLAILGYRWHDLLQKNKWCWQVLYLSVSLSLVETRPGVLKDLKTMGSVSLFIFFVTLLVLARQVSYFYKPNHSWITTVGEIVIIMLNIYLHTVCMYMCYFFLNALSRVGSQFRIEELASFLTENEKRNLIWSCIRCPIWGS